MNQLSKDGVQVVAAKLDALIEEHSCGEYTVGYVYNDDRERIVTELITAILDLPEMRALEEQAAFKAVATLSPVISNGDAEIARLREALERVDIEGIAKAVPGLTEQIRQALNPAVAGGEQVTHVHYHREERRSGHTRRTENADPLVKLTADDPVAYRRRLPGTLSNYPSQDERKGPTDRRKTSAANQQADNAIGEHKTFGEELIESAREAVADAKHFRETGEHLPGVRVHTFAHSQTKEAE